MRSPLRPALRPVMRGVTQHRQSGGSEWSPAALPSLQAWIDADLLGYQDSAGTTPLTAVEQPVGLRLDLSGNGSHFIQPNAGRRPKASARVNQLTNTPDLGAAPWSDVQGVSTYIGNKIIPAATTLVHGRRQIVAQVSGRQITNTCWVKAGDPGVNLEFWSYPSFGVVVNLSTWAVTSASGVTVTLGSFDSDGYRQVTFGLTEAATIAQNTDLRVTRSTLCGEKFVGDGVSGFYLKNPDRRQANTGTSLPPYQRVNTATDYDTVGFPLRDRFDGVDDEMVCTFPSSLGSNCTVARSVPGVGAVILTSQTIGTSYAIAADYCALVIVDRALTVDETAKLTAYLNARAGL